MALARSKATMDDVRELLLWRLADFPRLPTPRALAASLSVERYGYPHTPKLYAALCRFRTLRQDARVAAAKSVLRDWRKA